MDVFARRWCQLRRRRGFQCSRPLPWAVVLAISISGCAHAGPWQNVGRLPTDATVLPVAGLEQIDNRCGPNVLAMVLNAYGDPIEEPAIAESILNEKADATLSLDLLLFARARGFPADFEKGNLESLLTTIASGRPVILLLNLEPGVPWPLKGRPLWHYVVAYGFSKSKEALLVHSGVGPKIIRFNRLESMWKPGGFWMMHLGTAVGAARGTDGCA